MVKKCKWIAPAMAFVLPLLLVAAPAAAEDAAAKAAAAKAAAPKKVEAPRTQDAAKASVGSKFSDFQLPYAFENKMAKFSDIMAKEGGTAKLTVLTFVNTSCASCMHEMKVLQALKDKHKNDLLVVAVVTDYNAKRIADALGADARGAFVYLTDPYFSVPPVYGFGSTPSSAYIDKSGKIQALDMGYIPNDEGKKKLESKVASYIK